MSTKLYVGNIPFKISEAEVIKLFSSVGSVLSVSIPTDRTTEKPRGFAFVEMESLQDAQDAVNQLHNVELGGRFIMVSIADDRANAYNRPKASKLGKDTCILCRNITEVYGFNSASGGVCLDCIRSLSLATRSTPSTKS